MLKKLTQYSLQCKRLGQDILPGSRPSSKSRLWTIQGGGERLCNSKENPEQQLEVTNSRLKDDGQRCGHGESFCLATGRCEKRCGQNQDGESFKVGNEKSRRDAPMRCKSGQTFCIATGKCSKFCTQSNSSMRKNKRHVAKSNLTAFASFFD